MACLISLRCLLRCYRSSNETKSPGAFLSHRAISFSNETIGSGQNVSLLRGGAEDLLHGLALRQLVHHLISFAKQADCDGDCHIKPTLSVGCNIDGAVVASNLNDDALAIGDVVSLCKKA